MFQVTHDYQQKWPKNNPLRVKGEFAQDIASHATCGCPAQSQWLFSPICHHDG
jgi:hypothetical protein